MIALRGAIHGGVFSSFMFFNGLLPVPQARRECSGTRHFFCHAREWLESKHDRKRCYMDEIVDGAKTCELLRAISAGQVNPHRNFLGDALYEVQNETSDEPTDEELAMLADHEEYVLIKARCSARMPIDVIDNGSRKTRVYQDLHDGEIYDEEEDGKTYCSEVRDALIAKGGAFDGTIECEPKKVVAFLVDSVSENFILNVE